MEPHCDRSGTHVAEIISGVGANIPFASTGFNRAAAVAFGPTATLAQHAADFVEEKPTALASQPIPSAVEDTLRAELVLEDTLSIDDTEPKCDHCCEQHDGSYGSGRFCGVACRSRHNGARHRRWITPNSHEEVQPAQPPTTHTPAANIEALASAAALPRFEADASASAAASSCSESFYQGKWFLVTTMETVPAGINVIYAIDGARETIPHSDVGSRIRQRKVIRSSTAAQSVRNLLPPVTSVAEDDARHAASGAVARDIASVPRALRMLVDTLAPGKNDSAPSTLGTRQGWGSGLEPATPLSNACEEEYLGVRRSGSEIDKWVAEIVIHGNLIILGEYESALEAALVYDQQALRAGLPVNLSDDTEAPHSHRSDDEWSEDDDVVLGDLPKLTLRKSNSIVEGSTSRKTAYRGVCWDVDSLLWHASVKMSRSTTFLGAFDNEEEAARRYDEVARRHGRRLNFPEALVGKTVVKDWGADIGMFQGTITAFLHKTFWRVVYNDGDEEDYTTRSLRSLTIIDDVETHAAIEKLLLAHGPLLMAEGSRVTIEKIILGGKRLRLDSKLSEGLGGGDISNSNGAFVLVDDDGSVIKEYSNKMEADRDLGVSRKVMNKHIGGTYPRVNGKRLFVRSGSPYPAAEPLTCSRCNETRAGLSFETGLFCSSKCKVGTTYVLVEDDGSYVKEYLTKTEAARDLGTSDKIVNKHLDGFYPRVNGKRLFVQSGGSYPATEPLTCSRCKETHAGSSFETGLFCSSKCKIGDTFVLVDNEGNVVKEYAYKSELARDLGVGHSRINTFLLAGDGLQSRLDGKRLLVNTGGPYPPAEPLTCDAHFSDHDPLLPLNKSGLSESLNSVHEKKARRSFEEVSSKFIGVKWDSQSRRWMSHITIDGRDCQLGSFNDEEEAARRADEAAAPLARLLNFPSPELPGRVPKESAQEVFCVSEILSTKKKRAKVATEGSNDEGPSKSTQIKSHIAKSSHREASFDPFRFMGAPSSGTREKIAASRQSKDIVRSKLLKHDDLETLSSIKKEVSRATGMPEQPFEMQEKSFEVSAWDLLPNKAELAPAQNKVQRPKKNIHSQNVTASSQAVVASPTCFRGQRIDAALIHCSEGPSLAVDALRSWVPSNTGNGNSRAPLGLVAGLKLLCARMTEEPPGGWVALIGGTTPPHGTDHWRYALRQAGLGCTLADICRHWSGDAKLLETCLEALGYLTETPSHAPTVSAEPRKLDLRGLISRDCDDGMSSVVDQALDQFSSCTKKGWLTVLGKLFEVVSQIAHSNEKQGVENSIHEDFCRMAPVLVLALKQSATSGGSRQERTALVKWCGRAVCNVLSGAESEGSNNITSQVLFEAGVLDAALVTCRAFSDSGRVQYWGLKMVVAILHLHPPAREKAADLGAGRVAAAAINRSACKGFAAAGSDGDAEIITVATQCIDYVPVRQKESTSFKSLLVDTQIGATDDWEDILIQCAADESRWNSLHTRKQKEDAISEYQAQLRENIWQRKAAVEGFKSMLEEKRSHMNQDTSWLQVRSSFASDPRFKAVDSRIERVDFFTTFVATLSAAPLPPGNQESAEFQAHLEAAYAATPTLPQDKLQSLIKDVGRTTWRNVDNRPAWVTQRESKAGHDQLIQRVMPQPSKVNFNGKRPHHLPLLAVPVTWGTRHQKPPLRLQSPFDSAERAPISRRPINSSRSTPRNEPVGTTLFIGGSPSEFFRPNDSLHKRLASVIHTTYNVQTNWNSVKYSQDGASMELKDNDALRQVMRMYTVEKVIPRLIHSVFLKLSAPISKAVDRDEKKTHQLLAGGDSEWTCPNCATQNNARVYRCKRCFCGRGVNEIREQPLGVLLVIRGLPNGYSTNAKEAATVLASALHSAYGVQTNKVKLSLTTKRSVFQGEASLELLSNAALCRVMRLFNGGTRAVLRPSTGKFGTHKQFFLQLSAKSYGRERISDSSDIPPRKRAREEAADGRRNSEHSRPSAWQETLARLHISVRGRIHQLFYRGELTPLTMRTDFLRDLAAMEPERALGALDRYAQQVQKQKLSGDARRWFDILASVMLEAKLQGESISCDIKKETVGKADEEEEEEEEEDEDEEDEDNDENKGEEEDVKAQLAEDEEDDDVHSLSTNNQDAPWAQYTLEDRSEMLWSSVEAQRTANRSLAKSSAPFSVLVDRDNIAQSLLSASGRGGASHLGGPVVNLLKSPKVKFGAYHLKPGGDMKRSWTSEGGGRGDMTEDLGGATAEAFSCFWDDLSSFEVATRSGWEGMVHQEGEVLVTIIDNELPLPPTERQSFVDGDDEDDDEEDGEDLRAATLDTYEAMGRVLLWAVVQRQPVPSALGTPLFLGQLAGMDLVRGPALHRLSEPELCTEALRCNPSLAWLVDGLSEGSICAAATTASFDGSTGGSATAAVSLASLSFGAFEDEEMVTLANREEKLRAALGSLLLDQRAEVLAAVRRGFTLNGSLGAVASSLSGLFTWQERSRLVSGVEKLSAASFISIVEPQYPEGDESDGEDEGGGSGGGGAASLSLAGPSRPESSSSSSNSMDPAILEANVALLFRVLRSRRFEGLVVSLLRFVTGCPSILDRTMRIKVEFVAGMPTSAVPTAHTCFQTLYLSAAAYGSEEHLTRLLEICALNSTAFGRK